MSKQWQGVIPAITTPFRDDLSVDFALLGKHATWLVDNGCSGLVALGSLGEGATLSFDEKIRILEVCIDAVGERVPVAAGISSLSTAEAVALARRSAEVGCRGLMVLPPYVYSSDWREMKAHMEAVICATDRSCLLYNNPIAYGTDFVPEQIAELAREHANLAAVKESSADVRRVTAIRALLEDRLEVLVGVDDLIVEGVEAGATGWIAGLVNALPAESVRLFELALAGRQEEARQLYRWFLPLLRLDTDVKLVQLIKLVQQEVGMGSSRVRPPRLELEGAELDRAQAVIEAALRNRPGTAGTQGGVA